MLTHAIRCHNFEHESESCENNNQSHGERERAQIKIEKKITLALVTWKQESMRSVYAISWLCNKMHSYNLYFDMVVKFIQCHWNVYYRGFCDWMHSHQITTSIEQILIMLLTMSAQQTHYVEQRNRVLANNNTNNNNWNIEWLKCGEKESKQAHREQIFLISNDVSRIYKHSTQQAH